MNSKIKALSIAGIALFLLVIVVKVSISLFAENVIIENILELQYIYPAKIDVLEYFYHNYLTLMKVEMIGLTLVLCTGASLITTAMYLKIASNRKRNNTFNKITSLIYSGINGITVIFVVLSIVTELIFVYDVICILVLSILTMITLDIILTFLMKRKTISKFLQCVFTSLSVITLGLGVIVHFDTIKTNIENNNNIINFHLDLINEELMKEEYIGISEEDKEEIKNKYMYMYEVMHDNKGMLIGLNYSTINAYKYMVARDDEFSLTTDFTVEQKELYKTYIEEETFNLPILLSLLGGLFAVSLTVATGDGSLRVRRNKIKEMLFKLKEEQEKLKNNEITEEEYLEIKKELFKTV